MINEYCGFLDNMFSTLLDVYTMKDWQMSWSEFLEQSKSETVEKIEKWKKENILED